MSYDPFEQVTLGTTDVAVTRLGLGSAEIGGLYAAVSDGQAASLMAHAWDAGVRYFDTAPYYGYGNAERRVGAGLQRRQRDAFALSTKVGRLLDPVAADAAGSHVAAAAADGFFGDIQPVRIVYDYSRDGVMRSVEDSLERLGLDRIDILYIHDADDHMDEAMLGAYPAMRELREQGVVGAIGAGMNRVDMTLRFAREGDFDAFMLAGRYTLLEQPALAELLPVCEEKGLSIVAVGVMNSGILANPRPGARYNYAEAPAGLIEKAQALATVCERHGVDLKTAAIQFPLAHPAVASVAAGVRTIDHFDDYPRAMAADIPADLWAELRHEGLIPEDVPTPTS